MQPYDGRGEDQWCSRSVKNSFEYVANCAPYPPTRLSFLGELGEADGARRRRAPASLLLRARAIGTARTGRPSSRGRCRDRDTSRGCPPRRRAALRHGAAHSRRDMLLRSELCITGAMRVRGVRGVRHLVPRSIRSSRRSRGGARVLGALATLAALRLSSCSS